MTVYLYTFLPALLVAVLIRLDAKLVGPYFAAGALLPGFGGGMAPFMIKGSALRFALIRRLAYPIIMGGVLHLAHVDAIMAALAGLMTGFLLAWPAWIAPDPPIGVAFRDALYQVFYLLVILCAGALSLFGFYFVQVIIVLSGGNLMEFLAENIFVALATLIIAAVLSAFTSGVGKSLSEKGHRRVQEYEQGETDESDSSGTSN